MYVRKTGRSYSNVSDRVVSDCYVLLWTDHVGDKKTSVAQEPVTKETSSLQHNDPKKEVMQIRE